MITGMPRKTPAETTEAVGTSAADDQAVRRVQEASRPADNIETWMAYLPQD
jgi:hypothetical protein